MPWFMFMMGVSFTFSMNSMVKKGLTKYEVASKMGLRAVKLFVLGIFIVNGSTSWEKLRVPGVLQRFFICYVVVGGLYAFFQPKLEGANPMFIDIIPYWPSWVVMLALEALWLFLTFFMPIKGNFE